MSDEIIDVDPSKWKPAELTKHMYLKILELTKSVEDFKSEYHNDKNNPEMKNKLESIETRLSDLENWRTLGEGKRRGITDLKSWIAWAAASIATILAIFQYLKG